MADTIMVKVPGIMGQMPKATADALGYKNYTVVNQTPSASVGGGMGVGAQSGIGGTQVGVGGGIEWTPTSPEKVAMQKAAADSEIAKQDNSIGSGMAASAQDDVPPLTTPPVESNTGVGGGLILTPPAPSYIPPEYVPPYPPSTPTTPTPPRITSPTIPPANLAQPSPQGMALVKVPGLPAPVPMPLSQAKASGLSYQVITPAPAQIAQAIPLGVTTAGGMIKTPSGVLIPQFATPTQILNIYNDAATKNQASFDLTWGQYKQVGTDGLITYIVPPEKLVAIRADMASLQSLNQQINTLVGQSFVKLNNGDLITKDAFNDPRYTQAWRDYVMQHGVTGANQLASISDKPANQQFGFLQYFGLIPKDATYVGQTNDGTGIMYHPANQPSLTKTATFFVPSTVDKITAYHQSGVTNDFLNNTDVLTQLVILKNSGIMNDTAYKNAMQQLLKSSPTDITKKNPWSNINNTWNNLNDEEKLRVINHYMTNRALPSSFYDFMSQKIGQGVAFVKSSIEGATGTNIPIIDKPAKFVVNFVGGVATTVVAGTIGLALLGVESLAQPQKIPSLVVQTGKGMGSFISQSAIGTAHGDPWAMGQLATVLLPTVGIVKGAYVRLRPDAFTGESLSLTVDVGRAQIPQGMSQLAARELLADVERLQLNGDLPASRLRALDGVPNISEVSIFRGKNGVPDIKLKSADGDVLGQVTGSQRVNSDILFHATADTEGIVKQARQNGLEKVYQSATDTEKAILDTIKDQLVTEGFDSFKANKDPVLDNLLTQVHDNMYFKVADLGVAEHHGMFFSLQSAQDFMVRYVNDLLNEGKKPSPGIIAVRVSKGELRELPTKVLDNPNLQAMRQQMESLAAKGDAEGFHTVYKQYMGQLENEIYAGAGTKIVPVDPTWYAKGDVPTTKVSSLLSYKTAGYNLSPGDLVPIKWFATEAAKGEGKGVPTIMEMYLSKFYGDISLIKMFAPWNLRFRPVSLRSEISTSNFLGYEPVIFSAVKSVEGRPSALITNPNGEMLVTRILGQERWDLPGGHPTSRWFKPEDLSKAAERELYEEAGLKVTSLDHTDTFQSTFYSGGKTDTFHIFEGFTKDTPSTGSEIIEYAWWDGISKTIKANKGNEVGNYLPLADFVLDAIGRKGIRDKAAVEATVMEAVSKRLSETKSEAEIKTALEQLDKDISDAVQKNMQEAYERGTIPYKPTTSQLSRILTIGERGVEETGRGGEPRSFAEDLTGMGREKIGEPKIDERLASRVEPSLRAEPRIEPSREEPTDRTETRIEPTPRIEPTYREPPYLPEPRYIPEPIVKEETLLQRVEPEPRIEPRTGIRTEVKPPLTPIPPSLQESKNKEISQQRWYKKDGLVAWQQGSIRQGRNLEIVWHLYWYPYEEENQDTWVDNTPPEGAMVINTNRASQTIQLLKGTAPEGTKRVNVGAVNALVTGTGGNEVSLTFESVKKQKGYTSASIRGSRKYAKAKVARQRKVETGMQIW